MFTKTVVGILAGCIPVFLLCFPDPLRAQTGKKAGVVSDSSAPRALQEFIVKAYEQHRKLSEVGAPVAIVSQQQLERFANTNMLPALNTVPGVRMEERSPGSYRLNIRGSSLRSPFGVRDIKIYYNEYPLTDPGGNTYLNELGYYDIQSLEIIKGAAGSLYGAGIGGAVLISSLPAPWQKGIGADEVAGSFNANSFHIHYRSGDSGPRNIFSYTHQSSDGYRQQTQMRRDIGSWESLLKTNDKQSIHAFIVYSDLFYQTPGALTLAEYVKDPRMARPPVGTQPGAIAAKAAVYQKNFTAGFSQEYHFNDHWQNTSAVYGAYTDFVNPGIRVYEIRQEPHVGGRSVFQYKSHINGDSLQLNAGAEAQKGFFETRDYTNTLGAQGALQTDDRINVWTCMAFAQADLQFPGGWTLTAGASFNKSSYGITRLSVLPALPHDINFENKVAPRLAVLKKLLPGISVYANASSGFSTPTVAEVEKSNGIVGPPLQPEDGIDYELGARGSFFHHRLYYDVNGFLFHIKNAIVQRIDTNGVSYSVNAGGTNQHGLETYVSWVLVDRTGGWLRSAKGWISDTWHDFHYTQFIQDTSNYSGNRLPSVPPQLVVMGMDLILDKGLYANITYTYSDRVALNDANSAYAGSYTLLGGRIGYRNTLLKKYRIEFFTGADNLFNTRYSLGDDFNAAAGRYYNAAPGINYFAGLSLHWL